MGQELREGPAVVSEHTCCQCGAVGLVRSKYQAQAVRTQDGEWLGDAPIPINWVCSVCRRTVCFNCTRVIEASRPPQFFEDVFCSTACLSQRDTRLEQLEVLHEDRRDLLRAKRLGFTHAFDEKALSEIRRRIDELQEPMLEHERKIHEARMAELDDIAETLGLPRWTR